MAYDRSDLDRWMEQGLISAEQGEAILAFERDRLAGDISDGPGRLANGISTVGAGVAIFATAGILTLFTDNWSSTEAMLAAIVAALVMLVAAWQLVRNGWGAPAGLCAICALVLIPVALTQGTMAAGWWPEDDFRGDRWEQIDRERERITGILLLMAIVPGMLTTRLGLRQPWMLLPIAAWFGATLLFVTPFENTTASVLQVLVGIAVAAFAAFVWKPADPGWNAAWWLQTGGLILAGQAAAFSAFDNDPFLALLGAVAAIAIFVVGATSNRTAWMVAGALASIFPIGSLIFEYFDGLAGLLVVAVVGLLVAFLPLMLLRRRAGRRA
jgi:hypothetical protein